MLFFFFNSLQCWRPSPELCTLQARSLLFMSIPSLCEYLHTSQLHTHTHTLPGTRVLFQQLKATSNVLQRASGGIKKTEVKFLRFLPICLRILKTYILSIKRIVVCPDTFVILFLEVQAFPSGYQWVFGKSIHKCSNITWHYLQRLNRTGKKHGHWPGKFGWLTFKMTWRLGMVFTF